MTFTGWCIADVHNYTYMKMSSYFCLCLYIRWLYFHTVDTVQCLGPLFVYYIFVVVLRVWLNTLGLLNRMGYFNIRSYLCSLLLHIVEHWTDSSGIRPLRLLHVFFFFLLFFQWKTAGLLILQWKHKVDITFKVTDVFCISGVIKRMVVGFMY